MALNLSEAKEAIEDLIKYDLIKKKKNKYEAINNLDFYFSDEDAAHKLIELNTKLSDKIHQKVLEDRSSKIYFGSHYFTIDSTNLPTLRNITERYEDQVDDLTYKKGPHDSLIVMKLEIVRIDEKT